jgi:hypothetical protein
LASAAPASSRARTPSGKSPSEKLAPRWHDAQPALPTNRRSPRSAAAGYAPAASASPRCNASRKSSNGVRALISVSTYAAKALPTLTTTVCCGWRSGDAPNTAR